MPSVAWLYGPESSPRVWVAARAGCEGAGERYNSDIRWAYGRGATSAKIWQYWREDGGDGYFTMRAQPERIEAVDDYAAEVAAMRRLIQNK
jgi:hypothetical protein